MVKVSILLSVIAVALSGVAEARNCTKGLRYCGYNLLKVGDYEADIKKALQKANQWTTSKRKLDLRINQSRFVCGDNGVINWIEFCNGGCIDGGHDKHDFC
ncbi:hypothetical protein LZ32DRAFT_598025 [Colletotrichum eremochloae]|nr:hypothetical protein LZ32DRAFT_598025 [Colletotrichum eremochloae]